MSQVYKIKAVDISRNGKLGAMPATWSTENTCPPSCPMLVVPEGKKAKPCYWFGGYRSGANARRLDEAEPGQYLDPEAFPHWISTLPKGVLWRDRVGGDQIPSAHDPEQLDVKQLRAVIRANKRRKARGFGFTHYDLYDNSNRGAVVSGYKSGFVLNASANSLPEGLELKRRFPVLSVTTMLPSDWAPKVYTAPDGLQVIKCPNSWNKAITCNDCQLCAIPSREYLIGFPAHGNGKAAASLIAAVNV